MSRFSRTRVIEQLTESAARMQKANGFDAGNGTAQLTRTRADAGMQRLLDRAVEYGKWYATRRIADDLYDGNLGT